VFTNPRPQKSQILTLTKSTIFFQPELTEDHHGRFCKMTAIMEREIIPPKIDPFVHLFIHLADAFIHSDLQSEVSRLWSN